MEPNAVSQPGMVVDVVVLLVVDVEVVVGRTVDEVVELVVEDVVGRTVEDVVELLVEDVDDWTVEDVVELVVEDVVGRTVDVVVELVVDDVVGLTVDEVVDVLVEEVVEDVLVVVMAGRAKSSVATWLKSRFDGVKMSEPRLGVTR